MIKNIAYENLKGSTDSHEVSPLTVITGGNFRGKTTVLQALILACNGFIPSLGKTNGASFQLSSGPAMRVLVEHSSGVIDRRWKQSGKAVKLVTSGTEPKIGGMLAADAFTQAKPADRLAILAAAASEKYAMPALEQAILDAGRIAGRPMPSGETGLDRAEAALEELKAMIADSKARKVQFEKTLSGLAQINAEDSPTGPPPDTAKALAEAQRAHDAAVTAERNLEAAAEDHSDARDVLESFLSANPHADVEPAPPEYSGTASRHLGEAVAELRNLENKLRTVRASILPALEYNQDLHATLEDQALNMAPDWENRRTDLKNEKTQIGKEADSLLAKNEELRKESADLEKMECCPTCQATGTGWKEKVMERNYQAIKDNNRILSRMDERVIAIDQTLTSLESKLLFLRNELPCQQAAKGRQEQAAAAAGEIESLQEQISQVEARRTQLQKHADEERKAGEVYNGKLWLHSEWKRLAANVARNAEAPEKLTAAREAAAAAYNAMSAASQADEDACTLRQAWADHQGRQAALDRARTEAEKEEETFKKLEGAANALKAVRDTEMRKMFTPVIQVAEAVSGDILPTPLTLHPTNGQIGRFNGTTFIPFEAMSGTEQLVAVASLQVALAAGGTVLLDEVARMDEQTKAKFLIRLEQMQAAGQLEQAILIDHSAGNYPHDWKQIAV